MLQAGRLDQIITVLDRLNNNRMHTQNWTHSQVRENPRPTEGDPKLNRRKRQVSLHLQDRPENTAG